MKPKEVKKLLNCSYTTLHNYVKEGKLKLLEHNGKYHEYDKESVMALYDKFHSKLINNSIQLFIDNEKHEFKLNKSLLIKVLNLINNEIIRQYETSSDN